MKAKAPNDAIARVAQARIAADRSLEALRARRDLRGAQLRRMPWWGVLLGGFVGGALAGRVFARVRPRRETLSLLATLGPLLQRVVEAIQSRWMMAAAAAATESATAPAGRAAESSASAAPSDAPDGR